MHYGLDIGGTKIELAIYDNHFNQIDAWRVATPKRNYSQFLATISSLVNEADHRVGASGTVGIGLPCIFDQDGRAVSANISCINNNDVRGDLSKSLHRVVQIDNDANTLALSEAKGGAGEQARILLAVVLGTGVAGGLTISGDLYQGAGNLACEFGHVSLPAILQQRYQLPLLPCGCGLMGCMDQYLSGRGLLRLSSHLGGNYLSVPELINAASSQVIIAEEIFATYVDCLACFLAQLTLSYDPDVIVLGGGLSNIELLYQRLPSAMKPYLFANVLPPKIRRPRFGDSSGVRGAAMLNA